jgi:hypothetical protein
MERSSGTLNGSSPIRRELRATRKPSLSCNTTACKHTAIASAGPDGQTSTIADSQQIVRYWINGLRLAGTLCSNCFPPEVGCLQRRRSALRWHGR